MHFASSSVGASNIANDGHRPIGFIWMIPGGMAATGPANVEVDEEEEKCEGELGKAQEQLNEFLKAKNYMSAADMKEKIDDLISVGPHSSRKHEFAKADKEKYQEELDKCLEGFLQSGAFNHFAEGFRGVWEL